MTDQSPIQPPASAGEHDPLEEVLRTNLAARARVGGDAVPNWTAMSARVSTTRRVRVRALVVAGVAALLIFTGGGVALGSTLGSSVATSSAPLHNVPGTRGGVAPGTNQVGGSAAVMCPAQSGLTSLFTRTTADGVTIRAFTQSVCGPVAVPQGSTPTVLGGGTVGVEGASGATTSSPGAACPVGGGTGGGVSGSGLSLELSNAGAVASSSVVWGGVSGGPTPVVPTTPPDTMPTGIDQATTNTTTTMPTGVGPVTSTTNPTGVGPVTSTSDPGQNLPKTTLPVAKVPAGVPTNTMPVSTPSTTVVPVQPPTVTAETQTGVFGVAEGAGAGWIAVSVPSSVVSVKAVFSSGSTDTMDVVGGYAVLAANLGSGSSSFTATLTMYDGSGAALGDQAVSSLIPVDGGVGGGVGSGTSSGGTVSSGGTGVAAECGPIAVPVNGGGAGMAPKP